VKLITILGKTNLDLGDWEYIPGKGSRFWLLDSNLNAHWLPYYRLCSPCNLIARPNAIVKLGENSREEVSFAFEESGVSDFLRRKGVLQVDLPWTNRESAREREKELFSQLTKNEVMSLYEKFKIDHELFGYQIESYLSYARGGGARR